MLLSFAKLLSNQLRNIHNCSCQEIHCYNGSNLDELLFEALGSSELLDAFKAVQEEIEICWLKPFGHAV